MKPDTDKKEKYLVLDPFLSKSRLVEDSRLAGATERHKISMDGSYEEEDIGDIFQAVERHRDLRGVVMVMGRGVPGRTQLRVAGAFLDRGLSVFFSWPNENAVEKIDRERLRSYWLLWGVYIAGKRAVRLKRRYLPQQVEHGESEKLEELYITNRALLAIEKASPVQFTGIEKTPAPEQKIKGNGVYLRMDFWAPINTGGSYGHTSYVAKELSGVTEGFSAFMAHRYSLIDEFGIRQIALDPPGESFDEETIIKGTDHYYNALKPALELLKPAYIYERIVLGNCAGARLSQDLKIPYIVEYNGSEISMKRSFDRGGYKYEKLYLLCEEAAFKQATLISVVSEAVKDDLVARGVDSWKIVVIPNGADLDDYSPAPDDMKRDIRKEFGWDDSHVVAGFIGTFGGWHGIDVLKDALPKICEANSQIRFLLIGDGNLKGKVDAAIAKNDLSDVVKCVGMVPHKEGARLLKACDMFVSPHNTHMVDGKFFGSPTKIFEYMSLGGGIVASDMEQIGKVLSPALRVENLKEKEFALNGERSVLCKPGDVDNFANAVIELAKRPDVLKTIGANARKAIEDHYSWARHVNNLWKYALSEEADIDDIQVVNRGRVTARLKKGDRKRLAVNDEYKEETQNQWDNDPCGSHYVKTANFHTLDWYEEVEQYRYSKYAPWMPKTMEFASYNGKDILEIGAGIGTDLVQFAKNGAIVTDLDLSAGHLQLARENFKLRGLKGGFVHHDAEKLPFEDNSFDMVYTNGVIHHTPHTQTVIDEIYRTLKPGGKVIAMVYAEMSLHYWAQIVFKLGLGKGMLEKYSVGYIMSSHVELTENNAKPLVKVYTKARLRNMFGKFDKLNIVKRQLISEELPKGLRWAPVGILGKLVGWNLVVKGYKPLN